MRHVIVSRVVLALAALLAVAVALFTWGVTRPAPEALRAAEEVPPSAAEVPRTAPEAPATPEVPADASGEELFARHCARCHRGEEAELAAPYRSGPDPAAARLADFLVDHHGPSPEGNARIAEHLVEVGDS